jgi:hypothetical protein
MAKMLPSSSGPVGMGAVRPTPPKPANGLGTAGCCGACGHKKQVTTQTPAKILKPRATTVDPESGITTITLSDDSESEDDQENTNK